MICVILNSSITAVNLTAAVLTIWDHFKRS